MSDDRTPTSIAMDEAIEASMEGRELFPQGTMFINGDEPYVGRAIAIAAGEGRAVVLCFEGGSRHVLQPPSPAPPERWLLSSLRSHRRDGR